jgi:hypothetical protein
VEDERRRAVWRRCHASGVGEGLGAVVGRQRPEADKHARSTQKAGEGGRLTGGLPATVAVIGGLPATIAGGGSI